MLVADGGYSLAVVHGIFIAVASLVAGHTQAVGRAGSAAAAHGCSCPAACGILGLASNVCPYSGRRAGPPGRSCDCTSTWHSLKY